MIVTDLTLFQHKSYIELSAQVRSERFPFRSQKLWWRFPIEYYQYLRLSGDPLVPALLLPCMTRNERLIIEAPVSEELLAAVPEIQAVFRGFYPEVQEIELSAPSITNVSIAPGPGVGCFFSGGVDGFYSLLKNQLLPDDDKDRITHLVFINGFDIKLKHTELFYRIRGHLTKVADNLGKKHLDVSTNLKAFGDQSVDWIKYYGSVLASVTLALGPLFNKMIFASSLAWHQLKPLGSHPDLDKLWSTKLTKVNHDGCEATRVEKIAKMIAGSELALKHLHVCWRNRNVIYNCGECEKCQRTMISLYLCTGQIQFPSFPKPLDPGKVRQMVLKSCSALMFTQENLLVLETRTTDFDQKLKDALREAIDRYLSKTQ